MPRNTVEVLIRARDQVTANTDKAKKSLEGFGATSTRVAGMVVKAGAVMSAALGAAAVAIGVKSIKAASDLEEVASKYRVVFRGVEDVSQKTLDQLTKGYGFARKSAMEWLASIQDTLVPMGLARKEAAGLSGEIVKLSIDMGSFNNIPTAEVMRDIQSALVGNHETVRKYGVVITEAALKQQAMTEGINKSWNEMTAAEKVMLRYKIILDNTADAQGDFARTQDSWANKTKILQEQLTELYTVIGSSLVDSLDDYLPKLAEVIEKTRKWFEENDKVIEQGLSEFIDSVGTATTKVGNLTEALIKLETRLNVVGGLLETIWAAPKATLGLFGDTLDGVNWLLEQGIDIYDDVKEKVDDLKDFVLGADQTFNNFNDTLDPYFSLLGDYGSGITYDVTEPTDKATAALREFVAQWNIASEARGGIRGGGGMIEPTLPGEEEAPRLGLFIEQAVEDADEILASAERWGDVISNNATMLTTGMVNAVFQGRKLEDVMKQVGQAILVQIVGALTTAIAKALVLRFILGPLGLSGGGVAGASRGGVVYAQSGFLAPGFKPMGTDTVPAMLTPGEMVLPQNVWVPLMSALKEVTRIARRPVMGHGQSGGVVVNAPIQGTMIGDSDDMVRMLTEAITDRVERGIANLTATTALEVE